MHISFAALLISLSIVHQWGKKMENRRIADI